MLWEILPNARGPLIVDTSLRIGYTTILLGTLGLFRPRHGARKAPTGARRSRTAARWLSSGCSSGRRWRRPMALMSFVLGLNLLADSLREESMKD